MRSLLLLAALSCFACSKKLDQSFEGTIAMRTTLAGKAPQDLTLDVKAGRARFDTQSDAGEAMHGIYDPAKNTVQLFVDATKTYLTLDFAKSSAPQPNTTPDASTAEKTGAKATVAGFSCENWVAKESSGRRSEVCVVDGVNFFDLTRLRNPGGLGPASMREQKMFPLRSVEFDDQGREVSRMEVTRVDAHPIDDARFAVPAGYTEQKAP